MSLQRKNQLRNRLMRTFVEHRLARAWYVKYPLDAYALGPSRFDTPVSAGRAAEEARDAFGEFPYEVWPSGPVEEVEEYEYQVADEL
jgi:hypothetical protein